MMNKVFRAEIGDTLEVYMDDMIVKSKDETEHTTHLRRVFEQARKCKMRFNLENELSEFEQESSSVSI
jgi:hypothetical protein